MGTFLVTGSSGLIGSAAVEYFDSRGHRIVGVDNNMRADFFGEEGDTTWNLRRLQARTNSFANLSVDVRDRAAMDQLVQDHRPDAIIHCAAQPSHDLARERPVDDFHTNAVGTLNLLEAARQHAREAPFVFMSSNKVYGDAPNELALKELETRWDYGNPKDTHGIDESLRIDQSLHSMFGASKAAADLMTQEYGRTYSMPTVCFRGGCLTGPGHSGVELHGFVSHLVKVAVSGDVYTIYGYKGKQVRDQLHSFDVVRAMEEFIENPRCASVYNLGGGRPNSASVLESIERVEQITGRPLRHKYQDRHRPGDHICYISNVGRFKRDYPNWNVTRSLDAIFTDVAKAEIARVN